MSSSHGILYSSFRAMFVAAFTVVGLMFGAIVVILGLSSITTEQEEIHQYYAPAVMPNADGVRKELPSTAPVILQVDIQGVIGSERLNKRTIREQLIESREGTLKNNRVKGILLNINSPGGTVDDADGIYRLIKGYKETHKVPVYAFVDGLCASGAMYIASAADKVYTSNASLVGNVGVIFTPFINVSSAMEKLGIQSLTLFAGKNKDAMNPLRPWKPNEDQSFKEVTDFFYAQFVDIVTTGRPAISKEKLINEYGADIFNPVKAKEYGFIDENGLSMQQVVKMIVDQAGIGGSDYGVIRLDSVHWFQQLVHGRSPLLTGVLTHRIQIGSEEILSSSNPCLYLYRPSL